jgi:hypothetical protein
MKTITSMMLPMKWIPLILTPVDAIQAFASKFTPRPGMKEKAKDKWFGLDQNTKDLLDKIDDKYKAIN